MRVVPFTKIHTQYLEFFGSLRYNKYRFLCFLSSSTSLSFSTKKEMKGETVHKNNYMLSIMCDWGSSFPLCKTPTCFLKMCPLTCTIFFISKLFHTLIYNFLFIFRRYNVSSCQPLSKSKSVALVYYAFSACAKFSVVLKLLPILGSGSAYIFM